MNKYIVRMEFATKGTDFAEVEILASSKENAKELAIKEYFDGNLVDIDYYASHDFESELDTLSDWEIEQKGTTYD